MSILKMSVQGMTCGHCVKAVESSLGEMPGVTAVKVDLKAGLAEVTYDSTRSQAAALVARVEEEGYKVQLL